MFVDLQYITEHKLSIFAAAPKSIVGGGPTYMAPEMLLATREGASYDGEQYPTLPYRTQPTLPSHGRSKTSLHALDEGFTSLVFMNT